jgi:hypothetical protein
MTTDGDVLIEVYRLYSLTLSVRAMPLRALKYLLTKVTNNISHNFYYLEIQTALVELEDKEKSIIGSSQWIGAFEVNLCV